MFLDKRNHSTFSEGASLDDAMLECAVDVEHAWGEMMVECCALEFRAYQESGDIGAVNEGVLESIKNWFKKVWNAIKRFFGKAVAAIRSKTMSCKEFYEKYKKDIDAGLSKIKDFKGYKYALGEFKIVDIANTVGAEAKLEGYLKKDKDEEATKEIIKAIASAAQFEDAEKSEDLMKNAQKKWQGGSTDKVTLEASDFNSAIANIKSDLAVKNAALTMKIAENTVKEMENTAEKTYKEADDDDADTTKNKNRKISFIRTIVSQMTNLHTKYAKMVNAEADQTMAIMRAAISASKKKDEGAYISSNEAMSYLRSQGIEF